MGGMGAMGGGMDGGMAGPIGGGMGAVGPSMGAVGGGVSGPPAPHERPPSSVKVFVGQIGRYQLCFTEITMDGVRFEFSDPILNHFSGELGRRSYEPFSSRLELCWRFPSSATRQHK
jgi:hypothetical protein